MLGATAPIGTSEKAMGETYPNWVTRTDRTPQIQIGEVTDNSRR